MVETDPNEFFRQQAMIRFNSIEHTLNDILASAAIVSHDEAIKQLTIENQNLRNKIATMEWLKTKPDTVKMQKTGDSVPAFTTTSNDLNIIKDNFDKAKEDIIRENREARIQTIEEEIEVEYDNIENSRAAIRDLTSEKKKIIDNGSTESNVYAEDGTYLYTQLDN